MKTKKFVIAICLSGLVGFAGLACSVDPYDVAHRFQESMNMSAPLPAPIPDPNNFSFIHITDLHYIDGANRHIPALTPKLAASDAFIIASGDLTDGGQRADFNAWRADSVALGIPVFSAAGNHDLWNQGWDHFKTVLGPSVYSIVSGNVRIIVLDSGDDTLGADQYKWLERELAATSQTWRIVVSHYNFFSPNIVETAQATNREEIYGMMRMFEKYHVNYVLMGHSHIYDHRLINGVNYVVSPSLKEYVIDEQKHFTRLNVSGGQMTHQLLSIY